MRPAILPVGDRTLVQIVDAALADATHRSGDRLACRPGCAQCCVGVFAITPLDAARLQHGLRELERPDPQRAEALRQRTRDAVRRLSPAFPGNSKTGVLSDDEDAERRFEDFANDE